MRRRKDLDSTLLRLLLCSNVRSVYEKGETGEILTSAISRLVGLVVAVILAVAVLVLRDAMSGGAALELGRSTERFAAVDSGFRCRAGCRG